MEDVYEERVSINKECIKSLIETQSDILHLIDNGISKINFLKCLPAGVVMTKAQIMQLSILGVSEDEIKNK